MMDERNKTLAAMLNGAYMEVIPTPSIFEHLVHIPRHHRVGVSCSPKHGIEPTLQLVERMSALPEEERLSVIPHISARMVRNRKHLREILGRLDAAGVKTVFIPAGDRSEPIGDYSDSLQLLRDIAEAAHDVKDLGIAGYPEKHPLISDRDLTRYMQQKQPYATYIVTQMCFDACTIIDWLKGVREAGITLPCRIGLPGVANPARLLKLSMQIGVGQSLRQLKKQKGLLGKLLGARPYQPDHLLDGLHPFLPDPELNVSGFHLFSFNDVERTERWRAETYAKLIS
ncbi:MAG: methylenetetrahydrofolate reductase [Lysobacterales bacterium]|jgi:methylenetetrahydrofolate reductase (NADPH)